ncbi:cuticle protein CP1876-like [Procambarus clarkii]|uniref:cuticle protein CP1876-like n=1 Tax=Procambarus clarkii TaxID=6728 RepID=UPI0037422C75
MRTLVVLAVIGVCSADYQVNNPGYQAYNPGYQAYNPGYGVQPKYVGPVAATIPAGIGGKVIPVSDTYEVAAAKDAFYKAYNKQLNTLDIIRSSRYGTPGYAPALPVHKAPVAPIYASKSSYGAPAASYGAPAGSYGAPAVSYGAPAGSFGAPAASYGVPAGSFGAPAVSYGAPAGSYGSPAGSYGAPAGSYGAPAVSYGGPIDTYGYHGPPTQVHDTPEVVAAKAEFFKLYNKQAAAAAAAPDYYT